MNRKIFSMFEFLTTARAIFIKLMMMFFAPQGSFSVANMLVAMSMLLEYNLFLTLSSWVFLLVFAARHHVVSEVVFMRIQ